MMKKLLCAVLMVMIFATCAFCDANYDLFTAVINEDIQKVNAALNAGADPNFKARGTTLLMFGVVIHHNTEIIKTLIAAGADIDAVDSVGASVKDYAIRASNAAIREMFADKFTVQDKLFIALREAKSIAEIQELLDAGADLKAEDVLGVSAMAYAVLNTNPAIIKMVIDAGVDVNEIGGRDSKGISALMMAAQINTNVDIIRELIRAGANVNAVDDNGKSALFYAMDRAGDRTETVSILLESGADVKQKDKKNDDVLQYMMYSVKEDKTHTPEESFGLMKMLIRAGADVDAKVRKRKSCRERLQESKKYYSAKKSPTPEDLASLQRVDELLEMIKAK